MVERNSLLTSRRPLKSTAGSNPALSVLVCFLFYTPHRLAISHRNLTMRTETSTCFERCSQSSPISYTNKVKKKKQTKYTLPTALSLVIPITILIVIILLIIFAYIRNTYQNNTSLIKKELSFSHLTYSEIQEENNIQIPNLEIFPPDYEQTLNKLNISLTQHQKTKLLRYSQTSQISEHTKISQAYEKLLESNSNILIKEEYINEYFLNRSVQILKEIYTTSKHEDIPNTILKEDINIQKCIEENNENILKYFNNDIDENTCNLTTDLNTKEVNNIENISDWIFTLRKENPSNEYDTYIHSQLTQYYITKRNMYLESISNTYDKEYTGEIYTDISKENINRLKYLSEYIFSIYEQLNIEDENIYTQIQDLKDILEKKEKSNLIEIVLSNLIDSPESQKVELILSPRKIDAEIKTYIYPLNIYSDINTNLLSDIEINDNNFDEPYDIQPLKQSKNSTRIPVLMYHQIAPYPDGSSKFVTGLYVSPEDFEKQMAYLVKMNYKTVSSKEFNELLKEGGNPKQKTIMLTFDDGLSNHYKTAYPILKKYGLTGVFYVVSSRSGIYSNQLKEMAQNGMSIDSHSSTHPDLSKLTKPEDLSYQIVSSRSSLTARTGYSVYSIAYPGCVADAKVYPYVISAGYSLGFSCGNSIDHYYSKRYSLSRVHAFGDMDSFINILSGKP